MRSIARSRLVLTAGVFTAVVALGVVHVFGQQAAQAAPGTGVDDAQVPIDFLKTATPLGSHHRDGVKRSGSTHSGVPNIDSLANWTDQFTAPGFDDAGNPQSVWPYSMVGAPPESGRTTHINAPIIPVTVELLDTDGTVRKLPSGVVLRQTVTPGQLNGIVRSPIFAPFTYTSGTGQFNDQMMRAQFANRIGGRHADGDTDEDDDGGWHTLLRPSVKTTRVMQIPRGLYAFALNPDGTCCAFVLADFDTFANRLFPPTATDTSTPIGAAEHAGDMTTRDIATLLFNNVYLFDKVLSNCCVLGFHTYDLEPGDARNGNRERRYVMNYSSWISNGLFSFGFEDVTAFSHEVAELFNDPFVDNATPWWLSVDPSFGFALCQNNLETGDVIEVLTGNPVYAMPTPGGTYHVQNEALFPWFAFQSPSPARLHAYSFPDETTLTALSPGPLHPGCVP